MSKALIALGLRHSVIVAWVRRWWRSLGTSVVSLGTRFTQRRWMIGFTGAWEAYPLRSVGIVIVSGLCVNALFLWMSGRTLSVWGLMSRGGLLLFGLAAMGNTSRWDTVKRGSLALTMLGKRR